MSQVQYDLAIIGGGPGGYAAALRAAELGLKVAVIEKDKIGGTCLHRGCIPTTSLLKSASVMDTVQRADKFGIKVEGVSYDWQAVQKAKNTAVNRLFLGLKTLFKQRKVEVIQGTARLNRPGEVIVEGHAEISSVRAPNIIIATGSKPQLVPGLPDNPDVVLDTARALEIAEVPKSVAIIGGGAYGIEFASLFRSFGAEVTIIEKAPMLGPREDADISKYLERAFTKRGIKVQSGSKVERVEIKGQAAELELVKGEERATISAGKVLVTTGRAANTSGIDIDALGIKTRDGFIETDSDMMTGAEGVYAVGDVTYNPQYANFAFQEGIHVAERVAGTETAPLNLRQIPIYVFGYPEIAKVGYTESEAVEAGFDVETVGVPFQVISRSAIDKEDIGFAKMVAVKDGPIIGIHLVGPGVTNLIAEATLVTNWEANAADVAQFLHPHPTFAEAIGEAALKLAGKPLHTL